MLRALKRPGQARTVSCVPTKVSALSFCITMVALPSPLRRRYPWWHHELLRPAFAATNDAQCAATSAMWAYE